MAQLTRTADQPLAFSEVQAFFGRLYPTGVDSFAIENVDGIALGTGSEGISNDAGWSLSPFQFYPGRDVFVAQDPSNEDLRITRNDGQTTQVSGGRMDAEVEVTFLSIAEDNTASISLEISQRNIDGTFTVIWVQIADLTDEGVGIYDLSDARSGKVNWNNNTQLRIRMHLNDAPPNTILRMNVNRLQVSLRNQTRYQRNTEPLAAYARGSGIVPGGGGAPTYADTGGFAVDDLNGGNHVGSTQYSWATGAATLQGATNNDNRVYTPGQTTGTGFARFGSINNGLTGQQIRNVTCEVEFLTTPGGNAFSPFFWVRRGNSDVMFISPSVDQGETRIYTINGTFDWGQNDLLRVGFFSNDSFTYNVNYFRVNLSAEEEFAPTGTEGGLNADVPTDGTILRLSDLRNVDDGREDNQQQSGGTQ